ncbi:hypothetical protein PoB_003055300 [Plakobranchus ocellatus]|uniref:Uncharacterized protein n=1 Tax=Plakobranchus ocellatus TaxID=259542 RepID=A0AAV4ABS7_9GAST|nr:hypothetical protein PoB_003055300 [Plakobranchus ocellatus]
MQRWLVSIGWAYIQLAGIWGPGLGSKRVISRFQRVAADCAAKHESESDHDTGIPPDRNDGARKADPAPANLVGHCPPFPLRRAIVAKMACY